MQSLTRFSYDEQTLEHIRSNVNDFDVVAQPIDDLRAAAVALVVVEREDSAAILLTRRAGSLRAHSGQWALPGGRIDSGETAEKAALRELQEDINLELPEQAIIGRLDDYVTRSGYRITPVVIWVGKDSENLKPNPDEVASIHSASFAELVCPGAPQFDQIPESDREVLSMKLKVDQIFAPTAAMLYQFREVAILGRATRVIDYDQPRFAWR